MPLPQLSHAEAYELIKQALPNEDEPTRLAVQAICRGETNYGRGWTVERGGEKAPYSHNWGADTMSSKEPDCGPNGFKHPDTLVSESGQVLKRYVTCFRMYPDDVSGIQGMARIMLKPNVREAIKERSLLAISTNMRRNGYFTLDVPTHLKALSRNMEQITKGLNIESPFVLGQAPEAPSPGSQSSGSAALSSGLPDDLPVLRRGSESQGVMLLQRLLGKLYAGKLDGDFGPVTEAAVRRFQSDRGLKVDGWVGEKTWGALP